MNIRLNSNERLIATEIISSKSNLSIAELSTNLHICGRDVRGSLKKLKLWFSERGYLFNFNSDTNISIDLNDQARKRLLTEIRYLSARNSDLDSDERQNWITLTLLTSDFPIPIKNIAFELGFSYSTILRDINQSKKWFKDQGLELIRKPGLGVYILGKEQALRKAICNYILEIISIDRLYAISLGDEKKIKYRLLKNDIGISKKLFNFLQELPGNIGNDLVFGIDSVMDNPIPSDLRVILGLHLSIMLWRIQQKHYARYSESEIERIKRKTISKEFDPIIESLKNHLNDLIIDDEKIYISEVLIALGFLGKDEASDSQALHLAKLRDKNTILCLIDIIINTASIYLHPALKLDVELRRNIFSHFERSIRLLSLNQTIQNPYTDRVFQEFALISNVSLKISKKIEKDLNIELPRDEIAFISMHLAAALERLFPANGIRKKVVLVCGTGSASSGILSASLRSTFPFLEIVDIATADQLYTKNFSINSIDAVISTIPLESEIFPVIQVSPFLDEGDQKNIYRELAMKPNNLPIQKDIEPNLISIIEKRTIETNVGVKNWQEAIDYAGNLLLSVGAIYKSYIDAMKKIINESGPYCVIVPGVALPHARPEDGVRRLGLSFISLERPVNFGSEEYDPVSLVFCISNYDNHSHLKAISELAPLVQNRDIVDKLIRSKDKIQVLNVLKNAVQGGKSAD